jgi:hypothetical protein
MELKSLWERVKYILFGTKVSDPLLGPGLPCHRQGQSFGYDRQPQ